MPAQRTRRSVALGVEGGRDRGQRRSIAMQSQEPVQPVLVGNAGLARDHLTLEITESVLVDSVTGAADRLEEIAATGVGLSLDDFGTGYSSLSYLSRFPVRVIKIDRSFVSGLGHSDTDEAIISAVVSLANRLGRHVLAEGIETAEQAEHVARLGCQLGQGYLYGRPEPAHALDPLLTSRQAEPAT